MPLVTNLYENSFRLALWKLTEDLSFLENKAKMTSPDLAQYSKITNEVRKKEWLAVRILLNEVLGFWPVISYMDSGKPILNNHTRHLSISHSREMVGILLCTSPFAGIDIEKMSRNIDSVLPRFLSNEELENINRTNNPFDKILHWCAKEAVFKSVNESNIEFSSRIKIAKIDFNGTMQAIFNSKEGEILFHLNFMLIDQHIVVWTT